MLFGLLHVPIFIGEVLSVLFSFLFLAVWAVAPPCFLGEVLFVFSIPFGLGLVYSFFFFFFWIIKDLLPKAQSPNKQSTIHRARRLPEKRKTDSTSPKNLGKGHQPEIRSPHTGQEPTSHATTKPYTQGTSKPTQYKHKPTSRAQKKLTRTQATK